MGQMVGGYGMFMETGNLSAMTRASITESSVPWKGPL